jgi:hypothetical protein
MASLTAAPGTPPPGDAGAPRAGTTIGVGNPFTDAATHEADYAALSSAMGFGLDKLAEKFPDVDKGFAARFLEMAVSTGAQVPIMVYSHEMGHFRAATADGANPSIDMTGYASGLTTYNEDPAHPFTSDQDMVVDAAGVNQEMANASYMFEKFARNGGARYQEAMGYLLAQTNMALYAANTMRHEMQGDVKSSDDIQNYIDGLNAKGSSITTGHLAAMAVATDLLSAPVWASLIGQVRFLANGQRDVAMPTIDIGDVKATFPNLHTYLSTNGPIVGGQIMIDPQKKIPVELSFDMRIDQKAAAAVGLKLFDVPIPGTGDRVTLNPFIRGTYDERTGAGVEVGTEVSAKIWNDVAVTGSVSFSHNDLLAEPTGGSDGVSAHVGITIPF